MTPPRLTTNELSTPTTRVLGIDPGLGILGFGVVDFTIEGKAVHSDWGTITTPKNQPDGQRLFELHQDIMTLLAHMKPDVVSIERIFFFRNATTMVPICQARGVTLLAIEHHGVPVYEYTPMQVKQAMTGYGKSKKPEIQTMVAQILGLESIPKPDDAADGLALALCCWQFEGNSLTQARLHSPSHHFKG